MKSMCKEELLEGPDWTPQKVSVETHLFVLCQFHCELNKISA